MYDCWSPFVESKAHDTVFEFAHIKDGEHVLEVAVGTGSFLHRIVQANPRGRNEGIDISEKMLQRAKKKLKGKSNYSLRVGDVYALPFPDHIFDVVVNNLMMDLIPEVKMERVLHEFRRVLKPGGRLVISSMAPGKRWYNKVYNFIPRDILSRLSGCVPVELEEDIRKSGFRQLRVKYVSQMAFSSMVYWARR